MEKFQIKNADGKYVSIGMDGKPKWFASPDMGYTYTEEEAETFKVILEGMNFPNLSVVKYDKDWWKEKLNSGGHSDSELARGIEVEKEHVGTLEKLVKGDISLEEAPKYIAKDHLQEDPKYYTKLVAMESKFSGGGPTTEGVLKIINQDPTVITAARITKQPKELGDAMPQVFVTINGKEQYLFEYYPDEISFTPEEFIGKTIDESRTLKFEKDKMYLQSHSYARGGSVPKFKVGEKVLWLGNEGVIGNVRNTPSGIIYTVDYSVSTPFGSLKKFEYVNSNQIDLLTKFAGGGNPNEQKKYYSTSRIMPFSEFVEIEVEERSNYEEEDIKHWKKKYGITDDSKVIWVALEPHIAARYQMEPDDWDKAKELYEADPEKYEVDEYPTSKGTLIEESDDGDDGFIMVLKENYADGGDFLESTDLYMKEGTHEKEYHLQIVRRGNGYGVVAQYGRRGAHLSEDDKGTFSSMEEAQKEFQKVKKSKLKKGYVEDGGGKPPEPKPKPKPEPKPVPTFNTGDYFTTSSGDRYQIKSIHSSGSRMQYESVSGIKTSIDLSTAIRFFEEGSWKLVKDAPKKEGIKKISELKVGEYVEFRKDQGKGITNEWLELEGKSGKVTKVTGGEVHILMTETIPSLGEWDNELIFQTEEGDDDYEVKVIKAPTERKLTRIEYYEKYGF